MYTSSCYDADSSRALCPIFGRVQYFADRYLDPPVTPPLCKAVRQVISPLLPSEVRSGLLPNLVTDQNLALSLVASLLRRC